MSKIMIVVGHPQRTTFCEAIGRAYEKGALAAGHQAQSFILSEVDFDPILRAGFRKEQPLELDLRAAYEFLASCDHLVLICPLWCLVRRYALAAQRVHRANFSARSHRQAGHRDRHGLAYLRQQIGPHRHDNGHADLDLSLVVLWACPQVANPQRPAFHRHQARVAHTLRYDRDIKAGHARTLVARDRGVGKSRQLRPACCIALAAHHMSALTRFSRLRASGAPR